MSNYQVPEGYKQTEVGVIPEDWDLVAAEEICELVVDCKNRTPPVVDNSDFAVVRTPNVRNGRFVYEDLRFTDEQSFHEWTARAVPQQGDILITREAPLGEVCLVPDGMKVCLGQRMMLYRPDLNKTASTFFLYALIAPEVQKCLFKKIGGSTVGHAKVNDIKALEVPLPPLPEQHAIAATLSDVDALVAALDKLIAKQRHLKTATMQQLLTGKKRLPGFGEGEGYKQTEVGVIPEDWEVRQLGEISNIDPENLGSATHPEYSFKYISLEDVTRGVLNGYSEQVFSSSPSRARRILRKGDILLSAVRPNLKSHIIFQKDGIDWVCSTGFAVLRCQGNLSVAEFLFSHLFSGNIEKQIETLIAGSNYPAINSGDVRKLEIPMPGVEEQRAIATVLSDMDAAISALETRRAKTQAIKQGMMQELLTGRTRLV